MPAWRAVQYFPSFYPLGEKLRDGIQLFPVVQKRNNKNHDKALRHICCELILNEDKIGKRARGVIQRDVGNRWHEDAPALCINIAEVSVRRDRAKDRADM